MWTNQLPLLFNPGVDVCVAEQFVPFKGQCEFQQNVPKHPGRSGIKLWVAADVETSYAWKVKVCTGKDADDTERVPEEERVVLELTQNLRGATVTCDEVFTSFSLAQELLKERIALVGPIKRNKPELPPKLRLPLRLRSSYSSIFAFTKTTTAVSYMAKKRKNTVLLSSKHRNNTVDQHCKKTPEILMHYNYCRAAVDDLEQVWAFKHSLQHASIYSC